jgi:hypothetical protein
MKVALLQNIKVLDFTSLRYNAIYSIESQTRRKVLPSSGPKNKKKGRKHNEACGKVALLATC